MLIASGSLRPDTLAGQTVVVTGAGGGIGFEAARALLWMGARVAVAEIDAASGTAAAARLHAEFPNAPLAFCETDVADEGSVARLVREVEARLGSIDVVCNNATVAPHGSEVWGTPIVDWDRSYAVNLRGPVLLARACLPSMVRRGRGVFVCVSSTGGPYLGAYETLKAAQVELANTLDAELDGTGVIAFTIGPGLVPTATANAAVKVIAPRLGLSLDQFYAMNRGALLSVEAAGAGFAAAIANAERYAGQEVSSTQALVDAGITISDDAALPDGVALPPVASTAVEPAQLSVWKAAAELCRTVRMTLAEQADGWRHRSFFERQWMLRDFRKRAGLPVERWLEDLDRFEGDLRGGQWNSHRPPLERLAAFYDHLAGLASGYIKDPAERATQEALVQDWHDEVERLQAALPV